MADRTPYQETVVKRYYRNRDRLAEQRLGELVSEIYLADGRKRDRLWQSAATARSPGGLPHSRQNLTCMVVFLWLGERGRTAFINDFRAHD
jgi:hypothetical protein